MIIAIAWIISILLTALVVWLTNDSAEHQRGYKSGYETGAADGRKAGYLDGELIGRKFGDAEGYERGRKDGVAAEQALQSLHRETIAALSRPPAQAQKPVPRKRFVKRSAEGKKGNGARKPRA